MNTDYMRLYNKIEEVKILVRDLIKKNKYKLETEEFVFIFLEQLVDLKLILDYLERD